MSDHIVKSYDEDLAALKMLLAQMGGLAEQQLDDAIDALSRRDTTLADRVIQNDESIDMLERQIEEKAILTIAKRQPMARDLREIMVAIRVASDLERIGDLAKNTAKRAHAISEALPRKLMTGVTRMGRLAQSELKNILDAYARSDAEKALEVWRSDEELDCALQLDLPRTPDLHDGGSAQHQPVHASSLRRQEHGAHRRSRHQHRREHLLSGLRQDPGREPAKERFNQHAVPAQSQRRRLTP